ncbi:ZIP family metal transporter [Desulfovibrio sp.]|uniref:ZIP family metal transporter n=1 Tax=Desulfovibrio sp. TaxID=885 RepID=UPI0023C9746F|nr:ZIP family metal transporter [Desulfovibrio sp.]MDE7241745.1 ZIP family metal transporter [Desulfovibrio sp.]
MLEFLHESPALAGLAAGLVTWLFTTLGAAAVFLKREFSRKTLDILLGFAGGVMLAASVWSLLNPALELAAAAWGVWKFVPPAGGFLLGALLLLLLDGLTPHFHLMLGRPDGPKSELPRSFLLVLAITLHNIPEALAVGVAFGAAALDPALGMAGALTLMFGIGMQNIPEGMAVSLPLLREGMGRRKAFFIGQLSGAVEPAAALVGALLTSLALPLLPWALGFAAGAMIFVTVEEVIPEAHASGNGDAATLGLIAGFVAMMCLDVLFG